MMQPDTSGRAPAADMDAEAVVLSAVLTTPDGLSRVSDLLRVEHFYSDANAIIYTAALEAQAAGALVSPISIGAHLRDRDTLTRAGGNAYLQQLALETPYVFDVESVARRIRDKARVRRAVSECQRIAAEGYGDVGDVDEWLQRAEVAMHAVVDDRAEEACPTIGEALHRVFADLDAPDGATGLRTGLPSLDAVLGPLRPGQLVVIGALSGIGKSALALNLAQNVVLSEPYPSAAFFSCEMEADEIATRALFAEARVNSRKVNAKRTITAEELRRLVSAGEVIRPSLLYIDDRPHLSPSQIRSRVRRLQAQARKRGKRPLALAVIDYVQLLDGRAGLPKGATRENEVGAIGRDLKVLAKEAGIPVIALAQLNADSEKASKPRKPRGSDLRESKALLQHADKVVLIHNPSATLRAEAYRDGARTSDDLPAELVDLIVSKNRGAETGTVQCQFWPSFTLFEERRA